MKRKKMLPAYQRLDKGGGSRFSIDFGRFACLTVSLPLFSFVFCVSWSLIFFFEASTGTHCKVNNYLPSISAAIGAFQPQAFVWQSSIILHAIPRFIISYMYYSQYRKIIRKNWRSLANFACIINVIENVALIGLSLWSSAESYEIHKNCFCLFIFASEMYMIISYFLLKNGRKNSDKTTLLERRSLKFKRNLFLINVSSIALAAYFFVRHNDYCEPGVYTLFAFFEYVVVLTNMGYHMTSYWDFNGQWLTFDNKHGLYFSAKF